MASLSQAVGKGKSLAKYRKGDTVFAQSDPCDGVFYVQSGDCKVSVISEQGKEAVVALHGKGDLAKVVSTGSLGGSPQ
jgi:CRP/FNR family cyclic AMP-dependent transcriptional regulator